MLSFLLLKGTIVVNALFTKSLLALQKLFYICVQLKQVVSNHPSKVQVVERKRVHVTRDAEERDCNKLLRSNAMLSYIHPSFTVHSNSQCTLIPYFVFTTIIHSLHYQVKPPVPYQLEHIHVQYIMYMYAGTCTYVFMTCQRNEIIKRFKDVFLCLCSVCTHL